MTLQFSETLRNAWLDQIETTIGASAILEIRTGAAPASCAAAATGTLLASISLPADWMNAASSGVVYKLGTWTDSFADASGEPGHFRLLNSAGTICGMQGTVTITGGGGDCEVDAYPVVMGLSVTVATFTLMAPGA
mgnify:CR=1 FL=1